MTFSAVNSDTKTHKKPFFKRLISNITGKTKRERIALEKQKTQMQQKAALNEKLAHSLSKMRTCADEFSFGLAAENQENIQKNLLSKTPKAETVQEMKYKMWKKMQEEKEAVKIKKDKLLDLYVEAKINGDKKAAQKYSLELAQYTSTPKTPKDIEKDGKEFINDRLSFLQGVLGMTKTESEDFYNSNVLYASVEPPKFKI